MRWSKATKVPRIKAPVKTRYGGVNALQPWTSQRPANSAPVSSSTTK